MNLAKFRVPVRTWGLMLGLAGAACLSGCGGGGSTGPNAAPPPGVSDPSSLGPIATITDVQDLRGDRSVKPLSIANGSSVTATTPFIMGKVSRALSQNDTVRIYDGATRLGDATVLSGTQWFFQTAALPLGPHSLRAVVALSGVEGTKSDARTFTVYSLALNLPHTGITVDQCYEADSDTLVSCSSTGAVALNRQQDGDRTAVNTMSYSLVPKAGGGTYDKTECVKDNVTGLIWEGKTNDGGLRDYSKTYTNIDNNYNGGNDINAAGNSIGYANAVNAMALCGFTDWRLPTNFELQTLLDLSMPNGAAINAQFFPNTAAGDYWTSSPWITSTPNNENWAWAVNFNAQVAYISGNQPRYPAPYLLSYSYLAYNSIRLMRVSQ